MSTMPSLHPVSVIAQQLFRDDAQRQYHRPAVTTRRAQPSPFAAPDQAVVPQVSRSFARRTWRSRLAHLVVHPVSTVRSH
jgi:hypothetical protein